MKKKISTSIILAITGRVRGHDDIVKGKARVQYRSLHDVSEVMMIMLGRILLETVALAGRWSRTNDRTKDER